MEVLGSVSSRCSTVVILLCGWHILCHQMPKYLIENAIKAYAVYFLPVMKSVIKVYLSVIYIHQLCYGLSIFAK